MSMEHVSTFVGPGRIVAGARSSLTIPAIVRTLVPGHVGVLVDGHFANKPTFATLTAALDDAGIPTTVLVLPPGEPTIGSVTGCAAQLTTDVQLLVAIGGGSVLDTAKAVAVLQRSSRPLVEFEGADRLDIDPLPIIALPTTAGTGSEVTGSCALVAEDGRRKLSIRSPRLLPAAAVLDPTFLVGAPQPVIRASGTDALGHAIESYFSTRSSVLTRALSLEAVRMLAESLPRFYNGPDDQDAASLAGWGSCLAGLAFNSARVGLGHALAAVVAPMADVPHGIAVGLALPHHLRSCAATVQNGWTELARSFGRDVTGVGPTENAAQEEVRDVVLQLLARLDVPVTLNAIGKSVFFTPQDATNILNSGRLETHPTREGESEVSAILQKIAG